jgi:hypothetical protein
VKFSIEFFNLIFKNFLKNFFYSYMHTMFGSFFPLPNTPSISPHLLPLLPTPLLPGRNCFALVSNFVEERV